ncbi:MAG TPA: pilus assembly protein [Elusimicrobiales bacterium]|nr:pilus assembly protein [Elusimicrobiales bacterium]
MPADAGARTALSPARRSGLAERGLALAKRGQVTIELLLVLPVFMLLLFFIMEMGNMGFQTILAHHCAYELARIGSLTAGPNVAQAAQGKGSNAGTATMRMKNALMKMFPQSPGVRVEGQIVTTLFDKQSKQMNEDLLVTLYYPAKLIFPGSSYALADEPKGSRIKRMVVKVRMPVERPYFK